VLSLIVLLLLSLSVSLSVRSLVLPTNAPLLLLLHSQALQLLDDFLPQATITHALAAIDDFVLSLSFRTWMP
jgi:hypothetical protein